MNKLVMSALALALSAGLVGTAVPAQADQIPAVPGTDPAPATSAAAYLAAQPEANNIIKTYYDFPVGAPFESYDDYGLTIDAAWALDAAGGQAAKLAAMTAALEANIGNYAFGGGSKSKISAFLLSQGVSNGATEDLIADIEGNHIGDGTPIPVGRLFDDPEMDDFNSPLTQAYAVSALNNGGSDQANAALAFMLDQQCTAGFFRSSFSARDAVDQTCNGAVSPTASVDTTGVSVLMLQDQKSKPVVKAAITKALDWLETVQATDGSFSSGNANATGLAGWVLGLGGRTASATKAADWLRDHQLANAGSCTPFAAADNGAVVLDDLGYTSAQSGPMDELDNSVAVRATTQALPALRWAAGGALAGGFTLSGPNGFVPAGSAQDYVIAGAPGDTVCVNGTTVVLDALGDGTASVTAPAQTGDLVVNAVDAGGETHARTITALGKTRLTVKLKKSTVSVGNKVVVVVSGLEDGEKVTVTLGGKTQVAIAKAQGKRKFKFVTTKSGKAKVKAVGEFANRRGKATVTVTP